MFPNLPILAETAVQPATQNSVQLWQQLKLNLLWDASHSLQLSEAIIIIAFGIIYMVYGWRIFKAVIFINFALLGSCIGLFICDFFAFTNQGKLPMIIPFLLAALLALFPIKFLRPAIMILASLAGGAISMLFLHMAIGKIMNIIDWLPFIIIFGLAAGLCTTFLSYRVSIMLFTSLQGSCFIVAGLLGFLKGAHWHESFDTVLTSAYLVPLLCILPTMLGMIFQKNLYMKKGEWAIPE